MLTTLNTPRRLMIVLTVLALLPALPGLADSPRRAIGDDQVLEAEPQPGLVPQGAVSIDFADAYDADPLGLVAYLPFTSMFTESDERWDVWICRTPGTTSLGIDLNATVTFLNGSIADYFDRLSDGRYRPVFVGRGSSTDDGCGMGQTHTGTTPRMYVNDFSVLVDDRDATVGLGSAGLVAWQEESLVYEGLQRRAEIDGASVTAIDAYPYSPAGSIAAHEIGHTIHWAHSGAVGDYDNQLDLMSQGWGGTHAFNLYSAGWIEPEQVAVHPGGDRTYRVGPLGFDGTRMIVLTTASQGRFYVLSVRSPDDPVLDANSEPVVDEPGVEVYLVDQRTGICSDLPPQSPCFGGRAHITPFPALPATFPGPYAHFHPSGSKFSIEGVDITVSPGTESLTVRVAGGITGSGWFVDDDASVFEGDIEWAAIEGITQGCNPPRGDRFCPDQPVTRGQMAAFLVRALGLPASGRDAFDDDGDSVFEGDINALAARGITRGCDPDSFCPDEPVTRGQMAAFLRRAYELSGSEVDYFTDDDRSVFEGDIAALANSGITRGCTATEFCPDELVTRGQMAAFLHRAEGR